MANPATSSPLPCSVQSTALPRRRGQEPTLSGGPTMKPVIIPNCSVSPEAFPPALPGQAGDPDERRPADLRGAGRDGAGPARAARRGPLPPRVRGPRLLCQRLLVRLPRLPAGPEGPADSPGGHVRRGGRRPAFVGSL